jgi:hypothetical protein
MIMGNKYQEYSEQSVKEVISLVKAAQRLPADKVVTAR